MGEKVMGRLKRIFVVGLLGLAISGCAPFLGGATYTYHLEDQKAGKIVDLKVVTNREIKGALKFKMNPKTGEVKVTTEGIKSGPNNAQAVIDALVKALEHAIKISGNI